MRKVHHVGGSGQNILWPPEECAIFLPEVMGEYEEDCIHKVSTLPVCFQLKF